MVRNDLTPNLPVPSEKQSIQATLVYFQLLFSHHQPPLAFQPWLFSLQSSLTVLPVRWHRKLLETTPANSPKQLTTSWWEQNAHIRTPMEHHVGAILVQHTDEPRQKISKLLSCISKFAFTNWFENKFHYVCIVPKMCRKAPQSVDSLCLLREPWQFPASSRACRRRQDECCEKGFMVEAFITMGHLLSAHRLWGRWFNFKAQRRRVFKLEKDSTGSSLEAPLGEYRWSLSL